MAVTWSNAGSIPSRTMEPPEERPIPRDEWKSDFTRTWDGFKARATVYGVTLPDSCDAADWCLKLTDLEESDGDIAARLFFMENVVEGILV